MNTFRVAYEAQESKAVPAAYAHMTLVNLASERRRLVGIEGFPSGAIRAMGTYLGYCELGALSPDYPYLSFGHGDTAGWADPMHYEKTGEMIKAGIEAVRSSGGATQEKQLAWLLGYAAHVVMDVTIHPIIELKVGPYQNNKRDHRICEMHQDAYIFPRMNLGDIGLSEHLDTGIAMCSAPDDRRALDPDIASLWSGMLQTVYPGLFVANEPDPALWHRCFLTVVDKIAEEGNKLMPLARHVAVNVAGITYPSYEEIDRQYIERLETPEGAASYDKIFEYAITNVTQVWHDVAAGVLDGDQTYITSIGNWDLDTGKDEANHLVYWG